MSDAVVLVINSGSSSVKYQLVRPDGARLAAGLVERIGEEHSSYRHSCGSNSTTGQVQVPDHDAAFDLIADQFAEHGPDLAQAGVQAVGHRVVHGGPRFTAPTLLTDGVVDEIEKLSALAPLHNPPALAGIRAARRRLPDVPHVAVFDTAFFADLPEPARTYAIPTELARDLSIRRYGFHGTSHQYVSAQAADLLGRDLGELNQIVFHLGNGCSASAIAGGRPVETSMGLTPLQGLVMGTRSGDVDPGLHRYLAAQRGWSADQIDTLLNKQSGLKGMTGDNDFRELERRCGAGDEAAMLAFAVYVHRIRCYLGAYLVVLGSLDALVFTGGVGENSPALRQAVTADLAGLGVSCDEQANNAGGHQARVISAAQSRTQVLVVPTDEELAIARFAAALA